MIEKAKKTELYKLIQNKVPNFSESEHILLTSIIALLFNAACSDKKVKKCEVKAISKSVSDIMGTEDKFISELIDDTFGLLKKLKKLEKFPYIEIVNTALDNEQMKFKILETLLYISASDDNLSQEEMNYCKKVANYFEISESKFAQVKANTEIELSKRTKEDFSEYIITKGREKYEN